jgi:serine/threonine protein kinase
MKRHITFNEEQLKFLTACVIEGLDYIHSKNIVHRDIKPENVICDDKGYVRITDFGVAKKINWDSFYEISGTVGYMAPEVFNNKRRIYFESDFFSVGVMLYEIVVGRKPYGGQNGDDFGKEDARVDSSIHKVSSNNISEECCDFINKLLIRDHSKRLGKGGISEIKDHAWLKKIEWKHLHYKTMKSPFMFKEAVNGNNKEVHGNYRHYEDTISDDDDEEEHEFQKQFEGYNCMHFLSQHEIQEYNMRTRNKSNGHQLLAINNNNNNKCSNKHMKLKTLDNNNNNTCCSGSIKENNVKIVNKKSRKSLNILTTCDTNTIKKKLLLNAVHPSLTSFVNSTSYKGNNSLSSTKKSQNIIKLPIINIDALKHKGDNYYYKSIDINNKYSPNSARNVNVNVNALPQRHEHVYKPTKHYNTNNNNKVSLISKEEVSINTTTSSNSSSNKYKLKVRKIRSVLTMN